MAFNIGSLTAAQQIQLIYTAYFGRAAEPNGFGFWTPLLEENLDGDADGVPGFSFTEIADLFSTSRKPARFTTWSRVSRTRQICRTRLIFFKMFTSISSAASLIQKV